MDDKPRKRGLGRGLSSLLEDAAPLRGEQPDGYRMISMDLLRANPDQPRKTFPPAEMDDLVRSISEKGVLQPLLVREDPRHAGGYEIVAGERRWRAAQQARLHEIPVIVRALTDEESLEIAIIENVQRADLNPLEEAEGYRRLIESFGHTQDAVAKIIGKSRPYIANALRLLGLPQAVKDHVAAGRLTAGHARALIGAADPAALAARIVDEGLSVRKAEELARHVAEARPDTASRAGDRPRAKDADTRALEADLSAAIGLAVSIAHGKGGGGVLTIKYDDLDQLDGVCQVLMS